MGPWRHRRLRSVLRQSHWRLGARKRDVTQRLGLRQREARGSRCPAEARADALEADEAARLDVGQDVAERVVVHVEQRVRHRAGRDSCNKLLSESLETV